MVPKSAFQSATLANTWQHCLLGVKRVSGGTSRPAFNAIGNRVTGRLVRTVRLKNRRMEAKKVWFGYKNSIWVFSRNKIIEVKNKIKDPAQRSDHVEIGKMDQSKNWVIFVKCVNLTNSVIPPSYLNSIFLIFSVKNHLKLFLYLY